MVPSPGLAAGPAGADPAISGLFQDIYAVNGNWPQPSTAIIGATAGPAPSFLGALSNPVNIAMLTCLAERACEVSFATALQRPGLPFTCCNSVLCHVPHAAQFSPDMQKAQGVARLTGQGQ